MKKGILTLTIVLALAFGYYLYYTQSDKNLLKNFADEVVQDSIKTEEIVIKYVKHSEKGKKLALLVLNHIREEYKKKPGKIVVYYNGGSKRIQLKANKIELKDTEKLYSISFNEDLMFSFLVTKESKIVVLLILTKGGGGKLSNERSDE
jgi:hypothetical protein